jgi:hypothetical protein
MNRLNAFGVSGRRPVARNGELRVDGFVQGGVLVYFLAAGVA